MRYHAIIVTLLLPVLLARSSACIAQDSSRVAQDRAPAEMTIDGPGGLPITVRMQGPYDANVPLQVVCYFEKTQTSDAKLFGAPVELDKRLGGAIASLRQRGEFKGDSFETILLDLPTGLIKPERLLLIGLGNEADLSPKRMQAVGQTALREAVRIGAKKVAFAPLIKDAGNDALSAADVENAVVLGMLLAYDTEKRLQAQGFARQYQLDSWIVEAGPTYFEETISGVKRAIAQAQQAIDQRSSDVYSSKSLKQ